MAYGKMLTHPSDLKNLSKEEKKRELKKLQQEVRRVEMEIKDKQFIIAKRKALKQANNQSLPSRSLKMEP